jgi:DnaK suppressor protein
VQGANSSREPEIPAKWRWHFRVLTRLRDVLRRDREERQAALREAHERGGLDPLDEARDKRESEELLTELSVEEAELVEVEAALARLRKGTYGICEDTGMVIPAERLRALPWTRFTQQAALRRESTRRTGVPS